MEASKLKFVLLGAAAIIIVVVVVMTQVSTSLTGSRTTPTPTPEETVYTGLSALYSQGLSDAHIEDLKFAFYRFFQQTKQTAHQVTISNVDHHINRDVGVNTYTFTALVNDKNTYQGNIIAIDISSIRLTLSQNGTQIFDSGVVKVPNR